MFFQTFPEKSLTVNLHGKPFLTLPKEIFIGNICNISIVPRTEMVWDDAMQEPTAADHGDVLYNIGINSSLYLILDFKKMK